MVRIIQRPAVRSGGGVNQVENHQFSEPTSAVEHGAGRLQRCLRRGGEAPWTGIHRKKTRTLALVAAELGVRLRDLLIELDAGDLARNTPQQNHSQPSRYGCKHAAQGAAFKAGKRHKMVTSENSHVGKERTDIVEETGVAWGDEPKKRKKHISGAAPTILLAE
jgi:hypothetical protein